MRRAVGLWPVALLLLGGCGMYGSLYLEEEDAPPPLPEITEVEPIAADDDAAVEGDATRPPRDDEDDPAGEP